MPPRIDLVGLRFDRLVVIAPAESKTRKARYLCKCDCGNSVIVRSEHLRIGKTKSCGCLHTTHKHTINRQWSKTYITWWGVVTRCTNSNSTKYPQYGAKGINICDRWLNFENFLEDMGERPEGKTIDRIDNSKGYYKENCRWATPREQAQNTKQTKFITYNGETHCISEWARLLGLCRASINQRIKKGWSLEKTMSPKKCNKK